MCLSWLESPTHCSETGAIGSILNSPLKNFAWGYDFIWFYPFFLFFCNVFFFFLLPAAGFKSDIYVNTALPPSESTHVLSLYELRLSPLIY